MQMQGVQKATEPGSQWGELRPGVAIRILHDLPAEGYRAALLRYAPGASVPLHEHLGDEHVFVLEGSQIDGNGTHSAGDYVLNARGSSHAIHSPHGCLVLIHWRGPIRFHTDETT